MNGHMFPPLSPEPKRRADTATLRDQIALAIAPKLLEVFSKQPSFNSKLFAEGLWIWTDEILRAREVKR